MQRIDAARERRLQQVRGIHRPAAGRAGADHRVDLVDEQDGAGLRLELGQHRLQPLLEIAAIARSREQRAHVERIDRRAQQYLGHLALDDAARQPFGDRRFADARLADIERVVLGPSAQDLNRALDLGFAADQRIDLAALRLLVEIDAICVEGVMVALLRLFAALVLLGSLHPPRFGASRRLGDTVARCN